MKKSKCYDEINKYFFDQTEYSLLNLFKDIKKIGKRLGEGGNE